MKVLVFGSQGWIAGMLIDVWKYMFPTDEIITTNIRVEPGNETQLRELIDQCDRVISCLGRTSGTSRNGTFINTIDYLEDELQVNVQDNLYAPVMLAMLCTQAKKHMLYIGTGCIFSWDTRSHQEPIITEQSYPDFFGSSYSVVKGFTDSLMKLMSEYVCNCRIRMPIINWTHSKNFITKIANYSKIHNMPNSMTYLPNILPIMINMSRLQAQGTFNMVNPGWSTHKNILEQYKNAVDSEHSCNFVDDDTTLNLLSKRSNNVLNTDLLLKWCNENSIKLFTLGECLEHCFQTYNKHQDIVSNLMITRMKNVLITGGCGFIGSHFINYLHAKYPDVMIINIDKMDYCSNEGYIKQQTHNYILYKINLQDKQQVYDILIRHNIDHIVHFAAQSHVDNSFGNSVAFTMDNVLGTHILMECCRLYQNVSNNQLQKIIHISTDEVYGEVEFDDNGCTERSLLNPTNPYAATKAGAEFIVRSYNHSFNLPIIITRGNNVYGPHQYPEKLIPRFIQQLLNNERMSVHGAGKTRRNFIHVDDVSSAIDCIIQKGHVKMIYNIGSLDEFDVLEIATKLLRNIKGDQEQLDNWIEYVADRYYNDKRYCVICDNLKRLGWKQHVNFDDGLQDLIAYWKQQKQQ